MHQNLVDEENIIGCLLLLSEKKNNEMALDEAFSQLNESLFQSQQLRKIFRVMIKIRELDKVPSLFEINEYVGDVDTDKVWYFAQQALHNTSTTGTIDGSISALLKLQAIRKKMSECRAFLDDAHNPNHPLNETYDELIRTFPSDDNLLTDSSRLKHISELTGPFFTELNARQEDESEFVLSSGIKELDDLMDGGFEIGLHVIAARPKMGKTEFMCQLICEMAINKKLDVCVESLEMTDFQILQRFFSIVAKVDKSEMKKGFKDIKKQHRLEDARRLLDGSGIHLNSSSKNTVSKIRQDAYSLKKRKGRVGAIFFDYLGLVELETNIGRHDLDVAAITRELKIMSSEFECPVFLLTQLNRQCELRDNKRPWPSDSRDSGSIEQDVDSWLALYRESTYHPHSPWGNVTEFILRLNRHGRTGTFYQKLTAAGFQPVDDRELSRLISMNKF